MHFALTTGDD